jgi:hypothetical protein
MQHYFSWKSLLLLVALGLGLALMMGSGGSVARAERLFSPGSIRGSYGFSFAVALLNDSGRTQFLSGTGLYFADGAGHLTGQETTNANGHVCSGTLAGAYTVTPNGNGTTSVTFTPTTAGCSVVSFQQSLVIMDAGRIVRVSDTISTQVTIFEEWRKQR